MSKTLIVVDMQNDFIDGTLGTKEAQAIVPNVKKKIEEYYNRGDRIIFTRDTHYENYLSTPEGIKLPVEHCIYNTHGWQIADGLEVPNCTYINKESFGWTHWTDFGFNNDIELIGLCSEICVVSNALIIKADYPFINVTVDASCCAGVTPDKHKAAMEVMKSCQIEVIGEYSRRRTEVVPSTASYDIGRYASFPVEVQVGGATIFVIDVEKFIKL